MPATVAEIPIETLIECGTDGGGFLGWYARGHWDRWEFHRQVCHGYGIDNDDRRWFKPDDVQVGWWRAVPCSAEEGEPGDFKWIDAKPKSRGAFRVTFINVDAMRLERQMKALRAWENQGFRKGANWIARWLEGRGLGDHVQDLVKAVNNHLAECQK